jgi:hypothetical protein
VLALRLRSTALAGQALPAAAAELDYPSLINKALPDTIRVLGWADVQPEFSARYVQRLLVECAVMAVAAVAVTFSRCTC